MPRKASQAAKKEASSETKSEGGSTRRSGRSTTKQEPSKETVKEPKEATRSRRSSTAAQTAASVADSKTPKRSSTSRGDDTSPSEGRQKSRRESVESPATRVKSTRRASSRVNYKESDGEEESAAPKYDENFDSNEEFGDSDSDEKNKSKGKTRGAKSPAKTRGAKDKAKGGRGRRGRPKKQSSDEEDMEPIELSEESIEVEEEIIKKPETPTRGGRSRRGKAESETKSEEKSASSRRSARASVVKEPPKKRPSRSLQAKRYTEDDDDDDIEEIDSKDEEDAKPQTDSGRKRKRGSTTESNKRPKEEEIEDLTKDDDDDKEEVDNKEKSESVSETDKEKESEKKESVEEAMEVDEDDAKDEANKSETASQKEDKTVESSEPVKEEKKEKDKEETDNSESKSSKEKLSYSNKQGSIDSSENLDESMHSFDSDQGSRAEQSISSSLEDSQDTKETKPSENKVSAQEGLASENKKSNVDYQGENSDSFQGDESSESKSLNETVMNNDQKAEPPMDEKETNLDSKIDNHEESLPEESNSVQDNKTDELDSKTPVSSTPSSVSHSKESANKTSFNGSENITNSSPVIHSASAVNLHPGESAPKANGAHDVHSNSVSENDQYYLLPGRKYVKNSKLGESIQQSVKDKSFGFVSYNLGITSADSSIQKEKLLNELNKLDAHIICIQQVSKSFYCSILEPSLDALGFKGTFSQPEESEKGMATFYKSSLFRLSGQSEASLKHLIEKEIEASSLDASDRMAVKSYVKKCGHVLLTHFATVIGMHSVTVANVQVPPTDLSIHALQVSCLVKEVVRVNGGTSRPFLLGGEFNMIESEASYQLLRDGYLSNDMIEELQRRKDVSLPGKENAALVNLLWKSFQHPSSTLCSCYKSVLDHEVFIPEQKATSRDLLWYSSDSLYTVGVLDASETLSDRHFSLKADVAFSV